MGNSQRRLNCWDTDFVQLYTATLVIGCDILPSLAFLCVFFYDCFLDLRGRWKDMFLYVVITHN